MGSVSSSQPFRSGSGRGGATAPSSVSWMAAGKGMMVRSETQAWPRTYWGQMGTTYCQPPQSGMWPAGRWSMASPAKSTRSGFSFRMAATTARCAALLPCESP